jgi:sterol desaturase/sphingolipid hydroxylase (fatty acid hydroxylase superfamily)
MALVLQIGLIYHREWTGQSDQYDMSPELPSIPIVLRDLFISLIVREALFYYSHRLFHTKRLYPYIHKIHHRFTAPIALAAQYAHPVEHLVANIIPIILPPLLLHSHIITFWIFLSMMLIETSTVHSGYDFWPHLAEKHDRHHEVFIWNFGACIDWFDWIHGTKEKQRVKNAFTDKPVASK